MITEPNRAVQAILDAGIGSRYIRGALEALLDLADGVTPDRPLDADPDFLNFLEALGRAPTTDDPRFYVWLGVLVRAESIALTRERGERSGE